MTDDNMPPLGETGRDRLVAYGKGALGLIPGAGSILAEVIGSLIPNQRLERLEDYCGRLEARLAELEPGEARRRMQDPERIDLFEEGAVQSARAVSDERRAYIANVVARGLTGEQREALEAKRVLRLLGEIDDAQVIILTSHLHRHLHDKDFYERHSTVLEPVSAFIGCTEEEARQATLHELARGELVRLGLLQVQYPRVKKGEVPEFDQRTGTVKGSYRSLSSLGRLLLFHIGLAESDEV